MFSVNISEKDINSEGVASNFWPMLQLYKSFYDKSKQHKNDEHPSLSALKDIQIAYSIYMKIPTTTSKRIDLKRSYTTEDFRIFVEDLIFYSVNIVAEDYFTNLSIRYGWNGLKEKLTDEEWTQRMKQIN